MGATCGCKLYRGKPCSKQVQFSLTHVLEIRMSAMDLSPSELDMAILGQISACTNQSEDVVVESRHLATERINAYSRYTHQGKHVCPYMFRFLHTVGMFRNLREETRKTCYCTYMPPTHTHTSMCTRFTAHTKLRVCD